MWNNGSFLFFFLVRIIFFNFLNLWYSQVTMLWQIQVNSKGIQPYIWICIPLLFTWICHNIVTWLYHKFKKLKKIILTKKKTKNYHCSTSSSVFSVVSVPDFSLPNRCVVISHFVAFCLVGCSRCGMWDLVPWPRMNLGPLCWKLGVLATGLVGRCLLCR